MDMLNHMQMPVYDAFFRALEKASEKGMGIEEMYANSPEFCSLYSRKGGRRRSYIYDIFTDKVRREEAWSKDCAANHARLGKERLDALESHGLREAYLAAVQWLESGKTIRVLNMRDYPCPDPYFVEERDLRFGCIISGFHREKEGVFWRITLFDRAVKEDDCLRGRDMAYLLYDGGIHEAVLKEGSFEVLEDRTPDRGMKYRYVMLGVFKDSRGNIHGISVPVNTVSDSLEKAENGWDNLGCWFKRENGRMVLEMGANGLPLWGYHYDKFVSIGGKVYSINGNPGLYDLGNGLCRAMTDEYEESLSFVDLFPEPAGMHGRIDIDVIGHRIEKSDGFYNGL